jgi:hypothetical protein
VGEGPRGAPLGTRLDRMTRPPRPARRMTGSGLASATIRLPRIPDLVGEVVAGWMSISVGFANMMTGRIPRRQPARGRR